ncbi:MAG: hypothetical protein K6D59_08800 [Bacteroidales bacterium]|nr:hypothetical protein [Bacteroidales bacterium]
MKKALSILTLFVALFSFALAQSTYPLPSPVGIGINSTSDDLHIHEATLSPYNQGVEPLDEGFRDDPLLEGYYSTTIRLTNGSTSFGANDGFLIEQYFDEVKMQQLENANYTLYGYSGLGLQIHKSGRIGIADTSRPEYKVNVGGNTHIKGGLNVDNNVSAVNGNFSGSLYVTGLSRLGNGFECSYDGRVRTKSLTVTLDGWSDYVFDEGYHLPSLYELEKYVATNRHLPDIPSAKEVDENGVDLGEMNAKLLQKVEELTLYVIDLQKQIDELKKQ